MEIKNLPKFVVELSEITDNITQSIQKSEKDAITFYSSFKLETFDREEDESEDLATQRANDILQNLENSYSSLTEFVEKQNECLKIVQQYHEKIADVIRMTEINRVECVNNQNKVIDEIIKIEEEKVNRINHSIQDKITDLIAPMRNEMNKNKDHFENFKKCYDDRKINCFSQEKQLREDMAKQKEIRKFVISQEPFEPNSHHPIHKNKFFLSKEHIAQLQEWTHLEFGNAIFISKKDNWEAQSSLFDKTVFGKKNLLIIVEDEKGNKFGGFIGSTINKYKAFIGDPKSFLFKINTEEEVKGMTKFDIKSDEKDYAFYLCKATKNGLFSMGRGFDLCVYKKCKSQKSYCKQESYDYKGIKNALTGSETTWTPTKIVVVQMN